MDTMEQYEDLELEVIEFEAEDVITASDTNPSTNPNETEIGP